MKARDVLALILLWIGVGAVAWGDEIGHVVGIVLTTLFYIYYTVGAFLRSEAMRH